ncbi:hypothetical protein [Campylobacter sp.]|uniref:hypothetical protein n=1 Tax=Campylobacter sp. TaxID=205 RepID=UPI0026DB4454|nr:hypothetical protein [Campylobacter sp.]MDO4674892.1 hypothetical protein [Campylobacter sp.]
MNTETLTTATLLGNLGADALLGLIVIALGAVVVHLYKQNIATIMERQGEQIKNLEEIKTELKENTLVTKANLQAYKENNAMLLEYMKKHCDENIDKLERLDDKVSRIVEDISKLKPWQRYAEAKFDKVIKTDEKN